MVPVNKMPLSNKVDNDLRPVTLTAILANCFERAVLPKISNYTKPIMGILQFAYQSKRSTDDAIITLTHNLIQHLDGYSKNASCLFIDYFSAFNIIQSHVLIERLYNVPARLQLLVLDFLTNRQRSNPMSAVIYHYDQHRSPTRMRFICFLFIVYKYALSQC